MELETRVLEFLTPYKGLQHFSFTITNTRTSPMVFQLKFSDPIMTHVQPQNGTIDPRDTVEIKGVYNDALRVAMDQTLLETAVESKIVILAATVNKNWDPRNDVSMIADNPSFIKEYCSSSISVNVYPRGFQTKQVVLYPGNYIVFDQRGSSLQTRRVTVRNINELPIIILFETETNDRYVFSPNKLRLMSGEQSTVDIVRNMQFDSANTPMPPEVLRVFAALTCESEADRDLNLLWNKYGESDETYNCTEFKLFIN